MIRKDKEITKRQIELHERFSKAYEWLNHAQRKAVKVAFCEKHGVTEKTFRNKVAGINTLFESEVEWIESYLKTAKTAITA